MQSQSKAQYSFYRNRKKINPKIYVDSQETTDIQSNFEQEEQS